MSKQTPIQADESKLIEQSLMQGESMVSSQDHVALDKYQSIIITEKSSPKMSEEKLSAEQRIIKDFQETGHVVWHTHKKSETLDEMDVDFKIVAAIHSLKQANKLHHQLSTFDSEWRKKAKENLPVFMNIFEKIEHNLREEHEIQLPETVEEMRELREELELRKKAEEKNKNTEQVTA